MRKQKILGKCIINLNQNNFDGGSGLIGSNLNSYLLKGL